MNKQLKRTIENLGWIIHNNGDEIELEQGSPLGEDFSFTINKENAVDEIKQYALDFDPDEHAGMWIEQRGSNGIPNSIRALLNDADEIQSMLEELAIAVAAVA